MEKPERAHKLITVIQADSAEELAAYLRQMAYEVQSGQLTTGCSGGYGIGSIYSYKVRPEQTHDQYFADLEAYLAETREAQKGAQG